MRRFLTSILWLAVVAVSHAADWALPSANQGWWTPGTAAGTPGVGVPGGIEQYLAGGVNDRAVTGTVRNVVTAHSADNTGATDVSTAVQAAITAASSGDVIYFPAGTYKFTGRVSIPNGKNNITVRGAGTGSTTFYLSYADVEGIFFMADAGYIENDAKTITGTKTKGTATLTVANSTNYAANQLAFVAYENEVDETRIEAGAAPTFSSRGYPYSRVNTVIVTGTTGTSISIDPPLPADGTNLAMKIFHYEAPTTYHVGWGFEDFTVTFNAAAHPAKAFNVAAAQYFWFYNVNFPDWVRDTDSGSCINFYDSYRCQVQKCKFLSGVGSSSDGSIQIGSLTSSLIVDNIFVGDAGYFIYENGKSTNNVIAYNYGAGTLTFFHNAHPSLNLMEGNYAYMHVSDGYHGSSSHNTLYGNYYYGGGTLATGWYSTMLHRFKRNYVLARNFFGQDGVLTGRIGWGWPNYNPDADGFSGPTGNSNQVGQIDRSQPGETNFTYVIQAGDVSAGDFPVDFETTGTLTTRTSDTVGVFAVSGGDWYTGDSPTAAAGLLPTVWWNSKASAMVAGTVTNVSGSNITMSWGSGTLPSGGTSVQIYQGAAGWQERDLDVQASSTLAHNYFALGTGTGSIQASSGDTFASSLAYSAKPAWFGSLPWPVFNVDSTSTADPLRLPAYYRYTNGNENYLNAATYSPGRLRILRR